MDPDVLTVSEEIARCGRGQKTRNYVHACFVLYINLRKQHDLWGCKVSGCSNCVHIVQLQQVISAHIGRSRALTRVEEALDHYTIPTSQLASAS